MNFELMTLSCIRPIGVISPFHRIGSPVVGVVLTLNNGPFQVGKGGEPILG